MTTFIIISLLVSIGTAVWILIDLHSLGVQIRALEGDVKKLESDIEYLNGDIEALQGNIYRIKKRYEDDHNH